MLAIRGGEKGTCHCLENRKLTGSEGNGKKGVGGTQKEKTKWDVGMDLGMNEGLDWGWTWGCTGDRDGNGCGMDGAWTWAWL